MEDEQPTKTERNRICSNCRQRYIITLPLKPAERMRCPHCGERIYANTGTLIPRVAEFHGEPTASDNPQDWKLHDFVDLIKSAGSARPHFDLELTMRVLHERPEAPGLEALYKKWAPATAPTLGEALKTDNQYDRIYALSKVFNHFRGVLVRADYLGIGSWSALSDYALGLKNAATKRGASMKAASHSPRQEEEYTRDLNENGEAVGLDIPMVIKGRSIIITGTLDLPRKEYQRLIEEAGGMNASSVARADYLVIGENHVQKISNKAKDAQRYDIPVVTLKSLKQALGMQG